MKIRKSIFGNLFITKLTLVTAITPMFSLYEVVPAPELHSPAKTQPTPSTRIPAHKNDACTNGLYCSNRPKWWKLLVFTMVCLVIFCRFHLSNDLFSCDGALSPLIAMIIFTSIVRIFWTISKWTISEKSVKVRVTSVYGMNWWYRGTNKPGTSVVVSNWF